MARKLGDVKWLIAGLGVGALFLAVALRGLDLSDVVRELRAVRVAPAVTAVLATAAFMFLKAWRWAAILRPGIRADLQLLHSAVYMGSAANLVVVHSGELLRAMLVGRRANAAPSAVLASIGVERIFDMAAVLALLAVMLVLDPRLPPSLAGAALIAGSMVAVGVLLMFLLVAPGQAGSLWRKRCAGLLPSGVRQWVVGELKRGLAGLGVARRPTALLRVFALSLLQWGCIVAAIWLSVAAVGSAVSVSAAIGVWVLMVIGLTLPSSPAQLGTTQLAFTIGLALTAAQDEVAFAASLVYVCVVNLPIMIIGTGLWLATEKVGLMPRVPWGLRNSPERGGS